MTTDLDLFGYPITRPAPTPPGVPHRHKTKPNGYAAPPGSGPAGEKCKTCQHYTHRVRAKAYRKCELMVHAWTGGPGTDIKANAPACRRWQKPH
jgi:hypothetical protein